ncbi:MAG: hypothetical protein CMM74_04065 [Rhodospirillaceae bacterium]|jgi:putative protein-disulfide isomerase|nr:hypothetical protein [Rhodospirillaceae bacterium]MDP6925684.1 DsbA family protein [Rhodospirillales bacterium]
MNNTNKELIYVGDPMCSWCYGFAPIKRQLEEQCTGRAQVTLIVGGLHIDWTEPQDENRRQFLRDHWREVGERSGQPFKLEIIEKEGFVYNTEAACRAAVTARDMVGNADALNFFTHLQIAFYHQNEDVTQDDVLINQAAEFGLDKEKFADLFPSDTMRQKTMLDFQMAQRLEVSGFPTVVVNDQHGYAYLTVGYQPYESLQQVVEAWLTDQLERDQPAAE